MNIFCDFEILRGRSLSARSAFMYIYNQQDGIIYDNDRELEKIKKGLHLHIRVEMGLF